MATRLERRVTEKRALGVPWPVFMMISAERWQGFSDALFVPRERAAARILCSDHPLSPLLTNSDLSNPAAVTPLTILEIWRVLTATRPRAILELGCGVSTPIFAYYARNVELSGGDVPRVYSIEHSAEWIGIVRRRLEQEQLEKYVTSIEAPLTQVDVLGLQTDCYDPQAIAGKIPQGSIDFCLIDGPPAVQQPLNRLGCLPLVTTYLAPRSSVLLDNTARAGERTVIARWRHTYPGRLAHLSGLFSSSGLASFVWNGDAARMTAP
jgi:predicted O-methyltransferase YrrM